MNIINFPKYVKHIYASSGFNRYETICTLQQMCDFMQMNDTDTQSLFNDSFTNIFDVSPIKKSLFIINGDCGLGVYPLEHYTKLFHQLNDTLKRYRCHLVFVRGNYDNPAFFNNNTVWLSNIKAVEDYTVLNANNHSILCVGGAVSLDKVWSIKQERIFNAMNPDKERKTFYWEDEKPIFNKEKLDEIIDNDIHIDIVVSHSLPSFIKINFCEKINKWTEGNNDLKNEINEERDVLTKIYNILYDNENTSLTWFIGHDVSDEFVDVERYDKSTFFFVVDNFRNIDKLIENYKIT